MQQGSGLWNIHSDGARSVDGEKKRPILRIARACNFAWFGSARQISVPNSTPQDRFETKVICERNDRPISSYHVSPDLAVARTVLNSKPEIRISDNHDRYSVRPKLAVARLAGNKMHLLGLDPSVEPRVKEAVRRGKYLTRPNQCAGAVITMIKALNDIDSANRNPRPSIRRHGHSMISAPKYATRERCRSGLLSLSSNEKERDSCYYSAKNGAPDFIREHLGLAHG